MIDARPMDERPLIVASFLCGMEGMKSSASFSSVDSGAVDSSDVSGVSVGAAIDKLVSGDALGAKLERALERRMVGQDAVMRKRVAVAPAPVVVVGGEKEKA